MMPFIACPVCFGATEGALVTGSTLGILALLLVTVGVLGAFGAFFLTLRRRAQAAAVAHADEGAAGLSAGTQAC
jgi:hypothetical protein